VLRCLVHDRHANDTDVIDITIADADTDDIADADI
jgi:hypothetical protein